MRTLAKLYQCLLKQVNTTKIHGNSMDLFKPKNFQSLRAAIDEITAKNDDEESLKAGLK